MNTEFNLKVENDLLVGLQPDWALVFLGLEPKEEIYYTIISPDIVWSSKRNDLIGSKVAIGYKGEIMSIYDVIHGNKNSLRCSGGCVKLITQPKIQKGYNMDQLIFSTKAAAFNRHCLKVLMSL